MTNQVRRLGILGGTFNPIHLGHMIMAENALVDLQLDEVMFTPAGRPPHKQSEETISVTHRVAMIEAAIAERLGFTLSDIDIHHVEISYTWRLLERIGEKQPDAQLWFIVGGDSLYDFARWARPNRILELARLAVIERPGYAVDASVLDSVAGMRDRVDIVRTPLCDVSSTEVRERIAAGRSVRYLVPESVRSYMEDHCLYEDR